MCWTYVYIMMEVRIKKTLSLSGKEDSNAKTSDIVLSPTRWVWQLVWTKMPNWFICWPAISSVCSDNHDWWYHYTKLVGDVYWIHLVRPSIHPSVCRQHNFRSITQVCFGISILNFICILFVAMGRSLLIFSDVTYKMAAWQPYWIFRLADSNFSLSLNITSVWLSISSPNFSSTLFVYMERSLLICRDVTFEMAAWWPYWTFFLLPGSQL